MTRFSLRDKRLFEINKVEITRVDCTELLPMKVSIHINAELCFLFNDVTTCIKFFFKMIFFVG